MSIQGKRLVAPISLQEVYTLLGVKNTGDYDLATICGNGHGRINPWSKKKPIRYDTPAELTDEQFKGTAADNAAGIYYGLQVASQAGRLGDLHTVGWTYLPPRPGTDWCRLTDFVGYDHEAKCTLAGNYVLTGAEAGQAYVNIDRSVQCDILYDTSGKNTTGVDIADMLNQLSDITIGDYYPCLLLGTYARSLYSVNANTGGTEVGDPVVTPLKRGDAWDSSFFAVLTGHPGVKAGASLPATVFLISRPNQAGIFDFRQQWVNVQDTINAYNAFSVPGAINTTIAFATYNRYPVLQVVSATYQGTGSSLNDGFVLNLSFPDGEPTEDTTYRISVTSPGLSSKPKEFVYRVNSAVHLMSVIYKWSDLGLLPYPGWTLPTTVTGSVSYVDSSGGAHVVSNYNINFS